MLLRSIRSIKCLLTVVGLFFCSGAPIADSIADVEGDFYSADEEGLMIIEWPRYDS